MLFQLQETHSTSAQTCWPEVTMCPSRLWGGWEMESPVYPGGGELNRLDEYIALCMTWPMMVFSLKKKIKGKKEQQQQKTKDSFSLREIHVSFLNNMFSPRWSTKQNTQNLGTLTGPHPFCWPTTSVSQSKPYPFMKPPISTSSFRKVSLI